MNLTKLSYIEFNNAKDKLEPGYYIVTEPDGDVSVARVRRHCDRSPNMVDWLTENEYLEHKERMDGYAQDMCDDSFEINDFDEVEDQLNHGTESNYTLDCSARQLQQQSKEETVSIADLLREALARKIV